MERVGNPEMGKQRAGQSELELLRMCIYSVSKGTFALESCKNGQNGHSFLRGFLLIY